QLRPAIGSRPDQRLERAQRRGVVAERTMKTGDGIQARDISRELAEQRLVSSDRRRLVAQLLLDDPRLLGDEGLLLIGIDAQTGQTPQHLGQLLGGTRGFVEATQTLERAFVERVRSDD